MIQTFQVKTSIQTEFIDITRSVQEAVKKTGLEDGICIIFIPHTTAAVTINENADPSVVQDILMELNKIVPFKDQYRHMEGNSPAHIKVNLMGRGIGKSMSKSFDRLVKSATSDEDYKYFPPP
jgi:secondary thiamine-phosphate synthase enzyme